MASIGRNKQKRSLFLAGLALVIFLTGGPAWANGLILCVCHDGHISLESTCQPLECCPGDFSLEAAPRAGANVCTDASEERPCLDVTLLTPSGQVHLLPTKASIAQDVVCLVIVDESAARLAQAPKANPRGIFRALFPSTDTLLKKTTVLLI
jgi:hypothetical protein